MNESVDMPDDMPERDMPERNVAELIHRLAIRQVDGTLTDGERAELVALLKGDAGARRAYLEHMQDTVSLRWMFSGHLNRKAALELAEHGPQRLHARRWLSRVALALAACLACVAAAVFWQATRDETQRAGAAAPAPEYVAMVTDLADVTWKRPSPAYRRMARVAVGQEFEFSAGAVELTFDAFAKVKVFGPAKFKVKSAKLIACTRGRVTTQVDEGGQGFTIETPKARIVDLGTEFGVDISESGDTQVVVFQGSVDLDKPVEPINASANEQHHPAWPRTLEQGDALLLNSTGEAQRVMAVQRGDFFPTNLFDHYGRPRRAPVILDVRDNIRELESTKCYQIVWGGLREDAPCFVDRSHQWNGKSDGGMPEFLLGADYVMPFNDDKFLPDLRVDVTLAAPATCYVFFDDNMSPPEWLTRDFEDTGFDVSLDGAKTQWHKDHDLGVGPGVSLDFPFSVWSRDVPEAGMVSFGGVQPPKEKTRSRGFNMYGIAVVPK
jgi:ferric-dicitrate binding protein FerR (iron transport regulator)